MPFYVTPITWNAINTLPVIMLMYSFALVLRCSIKTIKKLEYSITLIASYWCCHAKDVKHSKISFSKVTVLYNILIRSYEIVRYHYVWYNSTNGVRLFPKGKWHIAVIFMNNIQTTFLCKIWQSLFSMNFENISFVK